MTLALHPELQRWARDQGWDSLRPFQEESCKLILGTDCDLIISASTAAGKTEAALLPLLTLAASRRTGVSVLCLSPTKALINDQLRRQTAPAGRVGVPIFAWHGDASTAGKRKFVKNGMGIVFMTIESFEARLIRHPRMVFDLFSGLDAVVVDEYHEFLGGPRGAQLGSQLVRLDDLAGRRIRRIALSATIADPVFARRWLRPQAPSAVKIINGPAEHKELRSRIRGYAARPVEGHGSRRAKLQHNPPIALRDIESSIYELRRRGTHIIFAGSRSNVEDLSDGLARRCARSSIHNPFLPHHGSMAKHAREDVEDRLRAGEELVVLSTTTLALGMDIGSVNSVELIGPPTSITALRQCIGRSGRRNVPAAVCMHITERPLETAVRLGDCLRLSTVRACAALNLIERRYFEPIEDDGTALSVLVQQVLSIIAQLGGALFSQLLNLIQSVAAFNFVTEKMLRQALANLESPEGFIEQTADGRYVLTEKGEKLVHAPEFYASFVTTDQWDIVERDSRKVGSISLSNPLAVGDSFCLSGKPWEVTRLDRRHYRATVEPAVVGAVPFFDPAITGDVGEQLTQEMLQVLEGDEIPPDFDLVAAEHLRQGRATFNQLGLANKALVASGDLCHLLSWKGTRFNKLLAEVLRMKGFACTPDEIGVTITTSEADRVAVALADDLPKLDQLSARIRGVIHGKYDRQVPEQVLRNYWATRHRFLEGQLLAFCKDAADLRG